MTSRKRNWIQRMFGDNKESQNDPRGDRPLDQPEDSAPASNSAANNDSADQEVAQEPVSQEPAQAPAADDLIDAPDYPGLTSQQSTMLALAVRTAFRSQGIEASPRGQSFQFREDGQNKVMGMTNLVRQVAQLDDFDSMVGPTVATFVDHLLNAGSARDLRDADFYAGMRVRLVPLKEGHNKSEDAALEFDKDAPVRPFAEDAMIRLSLDSDVAVQALTPGDIADRGPVEDLYRMGYRNLWQDLIDSDLTFREALADNSNDGEKVWVLEGSSFYVGSAPLFLEELFERYQPDVDTSPGILFAMPHRHMTIAREVTSGNELMSSIGLMATLATEQYTSMPGQISPRLHLLHMGEVVTFTDVNWGDGSRQIEIQVKPNPYLMGKISEGMEGGDGPEGFGGPFGGPGGPFGGPGGPGPGGSGGPGLGGPGGPGLGGPGGLSF